MKHNKKFTPYNRSKMSNKNNKYLIIHWVGSASTAKNNADYFASRYIGASAHYFVDGNDDINKAVWQIVGENDAAWHVGASHYKHSECRNTNSIGIEICCIKQNGKVVMDPVAIERAAKLAKSIIDMWGIKRENILRHYDVTGKNCPAEFVSNENRWHDFINKIYSEETKSQTDKKEEGNKVKQEEICKKYGVKNLEELDNKINEHCGSNWNGGYVGSGRKKIEELKTKQETLKNEIEKLKKTTIETQNPQQSNDLKWESNGKKTRSTLQERFDANGKKVEEIKVTSTEINFCKNNINS